VEPRHPAPRAARARPEMPAARLDRPAHRARPGGPGRAHLRVPGRRGGARARAPGGARA
jgi:hypothetical protein